jgi:hypothetical protein
MPYDAIERWEWEGGFVETEPPEQPRVSADPTAAPPDAENESDARSSHDRESDTNGSGR